MIPWKLLLRSRRAPRGRGVGGPSVGLPGARGCAFNGSRARFVLAAILVALAACWPLPGLTAQELRGVVVEARGDQPAQGVLIEAYSEAAGEVVGRALTGYGGGFRLALPAESVIVLRALRVGYRPTVLDTIRLGPGEIRSERWVLTGTAITLERVEVVGRDVCRPSRADGALVVTLLEEVWKAVRSTQVRSTDDPLVAEWALLSQRTTLQGKPLTPQAERVFSSTTDRPFVSLPPDSLASAGYLNATKDGYQLFAPDADVLLSSHFLNDHCFRPEPWRGDDRDWIGLGFRPSDRRSELVGIEGTLWLDRKTAELQRLEYRYVNLPRVLATPRAGGEVEFLRLQTGAWLVHRWSIRMPRAVESQVMARGTGLRRSPVRTLRVTSLEVAGGEVRAIRAGLQLLYEASPSRTAAPVVLSDEDAAALCTDSLTTSTRVLWGITPGLGPARRGAPGTEPDANEPNARSEPGALILAFTTNRRWFDSVRRSTEREMMQVRAEANGLWVACGLPANEFVEIAAVAGTDTLGSSIAAWVPERTLGARIDLDLGSQGHDAAVPDSTGAASATEVTSNPRSTVLGTVFGRFVDSLQAGRGAPEVRVLGSARRASIQVNGGFRLDSLKPGEHTLLVWDERLRFLGVPPAVGRVRVAQDGSAEGALLRTPTRAEHFAAVCGRRPTREEGIVVGEVRDRTGQPRAGLDVHGSWVRSQIRGTGMLHDVREAVATTDADGWYVLCGVPAAEGLMTDRDVNISLSALALQATGGEFASAAVAVGADSSWLRRRDLVVGRPGDRAQLSGRVLDHLGRPVAGATVVLIGADSLSARTAENGAWTIAGVPVRSQMLTVRALKYLPADLPLDPLDGRLIAGEIRLNPIPQQLEARVVEGRRVPTAEEAFEDRRRSLAFGTFLDSAALKRQPQVTPDFLAAQISRATAAGGTLKLFQPSGMDALATCPPRWFVDGVDYGKAGATPTRPPGAIAYMQDEVLNQAVRIEVYRSSLAPAEFTDFDGCGSIVVWTR